MSTIEAMQRQLLGLIGRAVVKSISAATKCQTVDVSLIAGEPKTHLRQRTAGSADPRRGDFPVHLAAGGA